MKVKPSPHCIFVVICAIGLQACVDTDDPAPSQAATSQVDSAPPQAELQREIIDVHGCRPGFLQVGDVCVDPWPGGPGGGGPTGGEGGPSGPGGGGGGGGDPGPDATKWTCDVSCHLVPAKPGARCEGFVTGRGTGPSSEDACDAAKRDANSKVPRDCRKRHCKCRCVKGHETVIYDDDPITTVTHE